jgi:hypothetical protein
MEAFGHVLSPERRGAMGVPRVPSLLLNATATIHDIWGDMYISAYGGYPLWFNVATYVPAYTLSSAAVIASPAGAAVFGAGVSHNEGGGP